MSLLVFWLIAKSFSRVFVSSGGYCKISDLYDNSFRRSAEIKEANNYIKVQHEINNENTKKKIKYMILNQIHPIMNQKNIK